MNPSQALQLWDQRGFSLGIELGGGGGTRGGQAFGNML